MKPVTAIQRETLQMMIECSRDQHPYEFAAVMRAEAGVITEIMPLPGGVAGDQHAILPLHMLPIDWSVCGVFHSHPIPDNRWSDADLALFAKFGRVHVILAYPYNRRSWAAYDHTGKRLRLRVVD